jgi:hypothetical protein
MERKRKAELISDMEAKDEEIERLRAELCRARNNSASPPASAAGLERLNSSSHTPATEFSAYQSVTDDTTHSAFREEYQLDLSDDDLKCLQADFPLNEKVVNAVLHTLVALAPSIVTAVEYFADIAPDATRRHLQAPNAAGPWRFILIPIHNPTSGSSKGRWVLAVINFGVLRILDSSPTLRHQAR